MKQGAIAQAQIDAGQVDDARITIRKAIAIRDDIVDLYLLQGRIETAAKSPGGAFIAYNNAVALDSANGEALLGVAHYGMETGHLQEAEDAADRLLTLDPRQQDALLIKGIFNIVHFRGEDALTDADSILKDAPTNENGIILKARALSLLDRSDEALDLVATRVKQAGETPSTAQTLLELYRYKNDGRSMVTQLEQMRSARPDDFAIVLDEANTLYKLGDTARARGLLLGMIASPKIEDRTARLVTDQWSEYDPTPLDATNIAMLADRGTKSAKEAAARFYLSRNDAPHALAVLGNALADPDIVALQAQAAVMSGQVGKGLQAANAILAKDDTHCDALLARGQALLILKNYKEAIITSQVANVNCPQVAPAYVVLARANEALKNPRATEIAFRTGISRNSQDSNLATVYAAWLEQQGQGERALSVFRQLTRNAPALISGWKLYAGLCDRLSNSGCSMEAGAGLFFAKQRFAVDRRTDDPEPTGLFSRLKQKDQDTFSAQKAARSSKKNDTATVTGLQ